MARPERFELPTNRRSAARIEAGYSIQLSYGRVEGRLYSRITHRPGAGNRIYTCRTRQPVTKSYPARPCEVYKGVGLASATGCLLISSGSLSSRSGNRGLRKPLLEIVDDVGRFIHPLTLPMLILNPQAGQPGQLRHQGGSPVRCVRVHRGVLQSKATPRLPG